MSAKAVSLDECRAAYAECLKMIPLLSSQKYIEGGGERYCVRDMEFFASDYCVSWQSALAGMLEFAAAYDDVFCKIQAALLLREHPCPPEKLYEEFGCIRAWREEIWEARAMFDSGTCSPEDVSAYIDFRGKETPKKVTRISILAFAEWSNMACESVGIFEPEGREALLDHAISELERLKLQGKKIEFGNYKTTELLCLSPWVRKNSLSEHTVYGIELMGNWYCPEYRNDPDDQDDCWNDEGYGAGIQMLFDYDPDFRYDYADLPLIF